MGRRLKFQRPWVQIPAPYTEWTCFKFICCKKIVMYGWKDENKLKRDRGLPILTSKRTAVLWLQKNARAINKNTLLFLQSRIFLMSHSRPLFLFFSSFQCSSRLTFNLNVADDWIWTTDLWSWKQPLYQLSHNHCYSLNIVTMTCFLFKFPSICCFRFRWSFQRVFISGTLEDQGKISVLWVVVPGFESAHLIVVVCCCHKRQFWSKKIFEMENISVTYFVFFDSWT